MTEDADAIPGAIPLITVAHRIGREGIDAVALELGNAFFLLHHRDLHRPAVLQETITADAGVTTADVGFFVLPIKKRVQESSFPYVSVGRTRNNDIALADVTVSKFHAFLRERDGVFVVQDAGSRNGTFVNNLAVPRRGEGAPVELTARSPVRFGSVSLTFATAADLVELGLALRPRG